jgi:HEAT repeat protein
MREIDDAEIERELEKHSADVPGAVPDAPPYGGAPDPYLASMDGDIPKASGNRKAIVGFIIFLIAGAAGGIYWYKDNADLEVWQKKVADAAALAKKGDNAGLKDILQKCERKEILLDVVYTLGVSKDATAAPQLIKLLARGDNVAEEAAMALATIGGPEAKAGADEIFKQLGPSKDVGRARFAWALCALGDERGMTALLEAVGKQIANPKTIHGWDPAVIARMANTDRLIEMANSSNEMIQFHAAQELGFRKDKDTIPSLIKLLGSTGRNVVVEAAVALGRSTDERARKALVDKLRNDSGLIDLILTTVTMSVGAPSLEVIYDGMTDVDVKFKIVGRLKELKDPRSKDFLVKVLNEKLPYVTPKEKLDADNIHNQALWTLEDLGDPRIADKMFEKTQWLAMTEEQIPDPATRYRQDDMTRRLANGIPSWFARVKPPGFGDYLQKIYDANAPYSNTPECAKRVKVDIGPLMDAMGRCGDQRFCSVIKPFLDQDEKFHFQAASLAIGRLKCPDAAKEFAKRMAMTSKERKEESFSTSIETREFSMETRLQERRNSILACRYLNDAKTADAMMLIAIDPKDDPELRTEAGISLSFITDEKVLGKILEKIKDTAAEMGARTLLLEGLAYNPSPAAVDAAFGVLEKETDAALVRAAALVIGESADPANDDRLNKLLDDTDENRRRAAIFAVLLGGSTARIDKVADLILSGPETGLLLSQYYEDRPVLLTATMFEKKRIFRRLAVADALMKAGETRSGDLSWAWKRLIERLKNGWDMSPGSLNQREIRDLIADAVRNDAAYRELAAATLVGLAERGELLALQAEDGPQAAVARAALEKWGGGNKAP